MNIAILIPELGGGGAERAATLLGDYYHDRGHQVYFFLADTNIRKQYFPKGEIINTGIDLDYSGIGSNLSLYAKLFQDSLVIRKLKFKYKIKVAISYMEAFNYLNILSFQGERNIVSIRTILSERKEFKEPIYKKDIIKQFYSLSQCIVCVSKYARKDLIDNYGVLEKRVFSISNAVAGIGTSGDNEWVYGDNVLLTVGRLEKVKQHEKIIRAFSYLAAIYDKAKLLIIGDGPQRGYLESIVKYWKLENRVFMLGFQKDVGYFMKNSKAFVMASKTEGFPNSMIEAMSCGLPVISMDSPGGIGEIMGANTETITDISYQKYGILTPYIENDVKDDELEKEEIILGKAMFTILEDEELQKKYKQRSLRRASYYSIENVMKRWDRLILGGKVNE